MSLYHYNRLKLKPKIYNNMKRNFTFLLFALCFSTFLSRADIYYVKQTATGNGSGSDWNNASSDLQAMINAANVGDQIWVAAGTYKPTTLLSGGTTARDASFVLKSGVAVYGGFAGGENLLSQRNIAANVTILSGDIGNANDKTDNVYHVVVSVENTSDTRLDGFTITGGYADVTTTPHPTANGVSVFRYSGGGIFLNASSPILDNLIITGNECYSANSNGGGIYSTAGGAAQILNSSITNNKSGTSTTGNGTSGAIWISGAALANTMKLTNVTISGNSARVAGAIYVQNNAAPEFTNVKFINNSSSTTGGALYVAGSATYQTTPKFTDCEFSNNSSSAGSGGAMYIASYTSISSVNTLFSNNSSSGGSGGAIYAVGNAANPTTIMLTGGRFSGNSTSSSGGAAYISSDANANIKNVLLYTNTAGAAGGALFLYSENNDTDIEIVNSIFYDNTANGATSTTALGGGAIASSTKTNTKIKNCTFYSNKATNRKGGAIALYTAATSMLITNSIIYNNTTGDEGADIYDANISDPSKLTLKYSLTQEKGTNGVNGMVVGIDPLFLSTTSGDANFLRPNPVIESPVINAGDNASALDIPFDILGNTRTYDNVVDMGAYEYQGTLPVELTSFSVKKITGMAVLVSWTTASEHNNAYFLVQRSINGVDYVDLSKQLAKPGENVAKQYSFTDNNPAAGINYYRLVQVDLDGKQKVYDAKAINIVLSSGNMVNLYPNPVSGSSTNFEILDKNVIKAQLTNISGQVLENISISSEKQVYPLNFSKYPSGIYFLRVYNSVGGSEVKKILNP